MNRGESERDRLVLSIATEPLDALARDLVSSHGIAAVAGACRGESGSPHVPEAWVERVAQRAAPPGD